MAMKALVRRGKTVSSSSAIKLSKMSRLRQQYCCRSLIACFHRQCIASSLARWSICESMWVYQWVTHWQVLIYQIEIWSSALFQSLHWSLRNLQWSPLLWKTLWNTREDCFAVNPAAVIQVTLLLGPFYGAIAVPSVTRCRRRRCCCGHRCTGGVRQWRRATVATPGEW